MNEYIKREAVLKIIGDNCPHDKCGYNTEEEMGAGAACYHIMKDVKNMPTADVVEVVRCKDCVHAQNMPLGLCYLHTEPCDNEKGYKGDAVCVEPDDYCSYGERREE